MFFVAFLVFYFFIFNKILNMNVFILNQTIISQKKKMVNRDKKKGKRENIIKHIFANIFGHFQIQIHQNQKSKINF